MNQGVFPHAEKQQNTISTSHATPRPPTKVPPLHDLDGLIRRPSSSSFTIAVVRFSLLASLSLLRLITYSSGMKTSIPKKKNIMPYVHLKSRLNAMILNI
ncbi:hypothetical protein QJS04_geneDACA001941 [Acorus gramineus]|uniref:Uncharacterized protein n=1 Tax=Acorus gramineus TaxID=55184 RepID=A0AAV9A9S2_ACOGR|nr:hypothetical protein QJS04_geneDACA001941 [Acorus gramineus]